jgi:hypothetical protein
MPELHAKQCHIAKNYLIKNNMFDNDIKKVKELVVRGVVRDPPIAPEPTFLAKTMHTNETLFFLPKDWQQYKTASKEQKDRIKYLFKSTTLNGVTLPSLMSHYRGKQLYLGET